MNKFKEKILPFSVVFVALMTMLLITRCAFVVTKQRVEEEKANYTIDCKWVLTHCKPVSEIISPKNGEYVTIFQCDNDTTIQRWGSIKSWEYQKWKLIFHEEK